MPIWLQVVFPSLLMIRSRNDNGEMHTIENIHSNHNKQQTNKQTQKLKLGPQHNWVIPKGSPRDPQHMTPNTVNQKQCPKGSPTHERIITNRSEHMCRKLLRALPAAIGESQ